MHLIEAFLVTSVGFKLFVKELTLSNFLVDLRVLNTWYHSGISIYRQTEDCLIIPLEVKFFASGIFLISYRNPFVLKQPTFSSLQKNLSPSNRKNSVHLKHDNFQEKHF